MSQPSSGSDNVPTPDATIMKRLAYIRLLHRQATTQSYAPPPLNFSSVLMFHDVAEYFFIVGLAHSGNPQGLDLHQPFKDNARRFKAPDGSRLAALDAVARIAQTRNSFKHNGSIPAPDQIEEARRDADTFLEGNSQRLFGIAFSDISMLHIVPQEKVRTHLIAGRGLADADNLDEAMAEVAVAFDELITEWGRGKHLRGSSFRTKSFYLGAEGYPSRRDIRPGWGTSNTDVRRAVDGLVSAVTKAFEETDQELETMRDILRLQIAGIDMAAYIHFRTLTPELSRTYGSDVRHALHGAGRFHYTSENYDLCEEFVVESALRLARRDFRLWMPETYGDWTRAEAAAEANGGRLPDGWQ